MSPKMRALTERSHAWAAGGTSRGWEYLTLRLRAAQHLGAETRLGVTGASSRS
jgi:hypothetical protein